MTSRQRNSSSPSNSPEMQFNANESAQPSDNLPSSGENRVTRSRRFGKRSKSNRHTRRRHLLETLEQRQLLAGPQLIGVQPNEGELLDVRDDQGRIVNAPDQIAVRDTSPRRLTFRFDDNQRIDPSTLDSVQITRAGLDGSLGTSDDVVITPGLVSLGDPNENEVVVRFAESLPDDLYRINIFGYDDASSGIVGLRNLDGDLIRPSNASQRSEIVDFRLDLGALIESIVPQPVVRTADGTLTQNRNEVVVYFNEDPLFTENDSTGTPTARSAENPRFYQLILTQETVTTQDDVIYRPTQVVYDEATHTARLFFDGDINELDGVPVGGGTFRLRIGAAIDSSVELKLQPTEIVPTPSVAIDLDGPGNRLIIESKLIGENQPGSAVRFVDSGAGGLQLSLTGGILRVDYGGVSPLVSDVQAAIASTPVINDRFRSQVEGSSTQPLPQRLVGAAAFVLVGIGGTIDTASNLGIVGADGKLDSFLIRESISAQPINVNLPGGNNDPGTRIIDTEFQRHLNPRFVADDTDGTTEIAYNFEGLLARSGSTSYFNQITERQKTRIREALDLWSSRIGVQFRETVSEGITFGVGDANRLRGATIALPSGGNFGVVPTGIGIESIRFIDTGVNGLRVSIADGMLLVDYGGTTPTVNQLSTVIEATPSVATRVDVDAFGNGSELLAADLVGGPALVTTVNSFGVLDASLRIDPAFQNSALVFSNQVNFNTAYAEDFTRKAAAGIGLLLGLEFSPELPPESLLTGTSRFLEDTINPGNETALKNLEPVFPGNYDVLHGRYLYQPDSIDIDLYRFEVNMNDADRLGKLTVETFAERLADSSLLDTTLRLFQEVNASVTTDFNVGPALQVELMAVNSGNLGNRTRIEFIESDRAVGDTAVRVLRVAGDDGALLDNVILLDVPRRGTNITSVPVSDLIDAINSDPFASEVVRARLVKGPATTDISSVSELTLKAPLTLIGGGLVQLARNDDYFSEDSFLSASLGRGVYYVGVSASGNDAYDPETPNSGFGGVTQGEYEVLVKFDPNVDEENVIRDRDGLGRNLPGTPIDGDGDGSPGGVNQFWFQTRPEDRIIQFDLDGSAITPNQTIRIVSGNGTIRTYEFVPQGGVRQTPGSNLVSYNAAAGTGDPGQLARALVEAIGLANSIAPTGTTAQIIGAGNQVRFQGERSVTLSANFRGTTIFGKTIFVDKTGPTQASGSLNAPINNIASTTVLSAFSIALPNDQVRIIGNGGIDGRIETENDNYSYQFGLKEVGGGINVDGANMEVPKGVTTLIDAGAILKFRSARIGVGSSSLQIDRSGSLLQILGTPRLVQLSTGDNPSLPGFDPTSTLIANTAVVGGYEDGSVILTSMRDRMADSAAAGTSLAATPGDWGGIVYRSDFDRASGRFSLEDEGIFVDRVNQSEIRFGGGSNLSVDNTQQLVNPITLISRRPTITFNEITRSADAAVSASPDTFEETTFQSPIFQSYQLPGSGKSSLFIADYNRVGPDIHSNTLIDNSINGMFVRIQTGSSTPPRQLTVAGRFDDIDIVHHLAENLNIAGTPGGSINDGVRPQLTSTSGQVNRGGNLPSGTYRYKMTFVDQFGFESAASDSSGVFTVPVPSGGGGPNSLANLYSIELRNLPTIGGVSNFTSRRLYRSIPGTNDYVFVSRLDSSSQTFVDNGSRQPTDDSAAFLDRNLQGVRGRLDASLTIDPGIVMKLNGARIDLGIGTQLLAEGTQERPIVMTSLLDDRYGAGGTFDTNNDANVVGATSVAQRGDWSGIYAGPDSNVSLDSAIIAYGGGVSPLAGGLTRGFVPLQLQQASGRIVNSRFEFNQSGQDGAGPVGRFGQPGVTPSVIHVRGSQPIIVGNQFVDNRGSVIDIDSNSLNAQRVIDLGRESGASDRFAELDDNFGPLVRNNAFRIVPSQAGAQQQFSGMEIRGGVLTTESIWDDTDIVHLLFDSIEVGNFHSSGGLRLISRPEQSLVVKLTGAGNEFSPTFGTGLTAFGTIGDNVNRIGGTVQVVGMPGSPVILTSFQDDSIGAGLELDGTPFNDTNGDSFGSRPESRDWRSVLFDEHSNLTNMEFILERELDTEVSPGLNGTVTNAQSLGKLTADPIFSDDQERIGFEVEGFLSQANDIDTYSFTADAGTQVWVDVDATSFTLDTIVEILDPDGTVVARSDNSFDEVAGVTDVTELDPSVDGLVGSLRLNANVGNFNDFNSTNPRDAGLRLTLPGPVGAASNYFVRIRSASTNPDDANGGLTRGGYRFQVRTQEAQLFSGSMVRFADIRYANNGIHIRGGMSNSPLLGDAQESEQLGNTSSNDLAVTSLNTPGQRAQYLGNLLQSRNGSFSVGGRLSDIADVDHYQIDVNGTLGATGGTTAIFDIDYADGFNRPDTMLSLFYDPDGENGPAQPRLVAVGNNSNILADQGLANSDPQDLLSRGSIASGDAYIGPLTLPGGIGTYYIAVSGEGTQPEALTDPLVRREPIDSVIRIFDDQVNTLLQTTALPQRDDGPFIDTTLLPFGWTVTTDRARDIGHNLRQTFNGSRAIDLYPDSFQNESESNNTFFSADDLETLQGWSLNDDPNVGNTFGTNTSQLFPHTKVLASTINEIVDIYTFDVNQPNSTVILDVDNGFNPAIFTSNPGLGGIDVGDRDIANLRTDSVNLKLQLFDIAGTLIATNSFSPTSDGALGSTSDPLSFFTQDPFIQITLQPGQYYVAVSPEQTQYDPTTNIFTLAPENRPQSGRYELNVSVEDHPVQGGDANNQSLYFNRSEFRGDLDSKSFDLVGYSAEDQPYLYFDYLLSTVGNDQVRINVRSDQQPNGITLAGNTAGLNGGNGQLLLSDALDNWYQARIDLGDFAGNTGITVQFQYDTDFVVGPGPTVGGEGLYIDNFIVGFAERGEFVTGASSGRVGFDGASQTVLGEYQLEIRSGQAYRSSGLVNAASRATTFDTNARLTESMTLVAPLPSQIVDGNTFKLSDNVREVTFEFDRDGVSTAGNIPIDISGATTQVAIAVAIRNAINLPAVQALVQINATDLSGDTGGQNRDVQVALSGVVSGDFVSVADAAAAAQDPTPQAPAGGTLALSAIYTNLIGDSNVVRTQDQILIDSNRISDVHAIGIYSEPGTRGVDPQDIKFPPAAGVTQGNFFNFNTGNVNFAERFLQQPPIGSTLPGAVRNLPTLNTSAIGGLAPGIAIVNNTIDNAGYTGIRVDGELRPFMIDSFAAPNDFLFANGFGDLINDGLTFAIDAAGTRVVFEFEDISGAPVPSGGSGVLGGDGYVDGHVPVYIRHTWIGAYNGRLPGHTRHEVMLSIYESIMGSILFTNDLIQLVKPTIGPSILSGSEIQENRYFSEVAFPTPAVYLEGVTGIYFSSQFQKVGGGGPFTARQAAIGEAPQPFAKIVNNTIYGEDGTESNFIEPAIIVGADTDDTLSGAVRTHVGKPHTGPYTTTGLIGNGNPILTADRDVDLYEVELRVGDRLVVDVDTLPGTGPDTFLQLFTANGVSLVNNSSASAPDYLETTGNAAGFDSANPRAVDPYLDYTVTEDGTYFVAVSSQGNQIFDPNSISGRSEGIGGTGQYTIAIEAYAARDFVLSIDNQAGGGTGTTGANLIGQSFTITQIADRADNFALAEGPTNSIRFLFTDGEAAGNGGTRQNDNGETVVNIPVRPGAGFRVPEIIKAIENAINGGNLISATLSSPPLPNQIFGNGPDGSGIANLSGPILPVEAIALGGESGDGFGSRSFGPIPVPYNGVLGGNIDFQYGFGHDRIGSVDSIGFGGTTSTGAGTTELYVLIKNAAKMTVSGGPLRLDPAPGRNLDQLLPETGVMMAGGSSGVIFNNVLSNLNQSIVNEQTNFFGFGRDSGTGLHPKPGQVVVTSNAFQHDDPNTTIFRQNMNFSGQVNGVGLTTDAITGPSNVNGGTDDFNVTLGNNAQLFVHAAGDNFLPALQSQVIDTGITSVLERDAFGAVKQSVGLPINNILAPTRDGNGVLRADNDAVAPPSGLGGSLFLDLGANERADFNGPVAIIINPLDNDAEGLDADSTPTFIDRPVGGLSEFVIQLRDTGDSANPFTGTGIDDRTVFVAPIPGLRNAGDNVTVFENDRLLVEGIDYRFRYDSAANKIYLTPIAGIWRDDRSYRILLNNRDRNVLLAPDPSQVSDGDQVRITDSDGGTVVFEFETGYQLSLPEALTLIVPQVGTGVGGLRDGDIFQIADGINDPVVFEFDSDNVLLPGSLRINLPTGPRPTDPVALDAYLLGIAESIRNAITMPRADSNGMTIPAPFDFEVKIVRDPAPPSDGGTFAPIRTYRVVLGAGPGISVDTSGGGLQQDPRTLALQVPSIGGGPGGIEDGNTFTINDGNVERVFEFSNDLALNDPTAIRIDIANVQAGLNGLEIATLIGSSIEQSALNLTPTVEGEIVYLDLPENGFVATSAGQLSIVGISRPILDGDTIRVSKPADAPSRALSVNNVFPSGQSIENPLFNVDGTVFTLRIREGDNLPRQFRFEFDTSEQNPPLVTDGNIAIDVTRTLTPEIGLPTEVYISTDELARRIASAIRATGIDLNPVAQDGFIFIDVPANQTLSLETDYPGIADTELAQFEQRQTLEFHLRTDDDPTGADVTPGNIPVIYELTDTATDLAERVAMALNAIANSTDANGQPLIPGLLDENERVAAGQVAVSVDANNPVTLTVTEGSSIEVTGEPGVSGSSTVQVFGPLLLNVPNLGGVSIINGSVLSVKDPDGNDVVFQFVLNGTNNTLAFPGAITIPYSTNDLPPVIAGALSNAINASTAGVASAVINGNQVSLGRIDRSRVNNLGLPGFAGATAIGIQRGIVNDGEILRIRQGGISVSFEFDSIENGGGVQPGNVQVSFQPNSSPGDIAESLAAAIRNNANGLRFTPGEDGTVYPIAERNENGILTGGVILNDLPGTQVDISAAPTLNVTGVPGGAIAIAISPLFSSEAVKQVILQALNNVNRAGEDPTTTLVAEDRGGNSLFIENALIIDGPVRNFFLPAIKDNVGNNLANNREDRTTQFTLRLSAVALDFGDAPDPIGMVPGRYPTRRGDNGARHVIGNGPILGRKVDAEIDALAVITADGDDFTIGVSGGGGLFANTLQNGVVSVDINPTNVFDVTQFDGETFTIDTGPNVATFEFDTDGIFDEDNTNIWVPGYEGDRILTSADFRLLSRENIAKGIQAAIAASSINPAAVRVVTDATTGAARVEIDGDDEDGVVFTSRDNPFGTFNPSPDSVTPIEVTVNGEGILEAWIDFNADGDWDDPGELIISPTLAFTEGTFNPAVFGPGETVRTFDIQIPSTTPTITGDTYARFRVSRNGIGAPTGLALSGEVEDYKVRIVNGTPPTIADTSLNYTVNEDGFLQASDVDVDPPGMEITNDDGLLVGVTGEVIDPARPDIRREVEIFSGDVGTRDLFGSNGELAGTLTVAANGTFSFDALNDFTGDITFDVLAVDIRRNAPQDRLVSNQRITATISVLPVNDPPTLRDGSVPGDVIVTRTIKEDNVVSQSDQTSLGAVLFNASELIDPYYIAGPGNEPNEQFLVFLSAGFAGTSFRSQQGGTISIGNGGRTLLYTPPANYNGSQPDVFNYIVADREKLGSPTITSQSARFNGQPVPGRVEVVINAINDNPIVVNESYRTQEDTAITIPVFGPRIINGQSVSGILDNDRPGPQDEVAANQTISLKPNQFTSIQNGQIVQQRRTVGGGMIRQVGDDLIYTPLANFSGTDRFSYIVVDSLGAESTGTATIAVGNINKAPTFIGVRGQQGVSRLEFQERKQSGETVTFDLNSWFADSDGDALTFQIASNNNSSLIQPTIVNNVLTIDFTPFASGETKFTLTATDPSGLSISPEITVNVANTPDAPTVAGSFNPTRILEDTVFVGDLKRAPGETTGLFLDRDNDPLTYRVTRLGNIVNPTQAQITANPLIKSIGFIGDTVRIVPEQFQSGSTVIEIEASDGTFINSHSFDFIVEETATTPIGNFLGEDRYSVPIGGSLRITDPALGLLRNDLDPDPGSVIRVDPTSITQPVGGTGIVSLLNREDGAFSFTTVGGTTQPVAGQTDTFTYRVIDDTGRRSEPVTVTITFNRSSYQNPINRFDVTGDGFVSAIDALRIINLLNDRNGSVNVSDIETAPPDYYDVNGDGTVTAIDVLQVINELNARDVNGSNGSGEPSSPSDYGVTTTISADALSSGTGSGVRSFASTQSYANASTSNLGTANLVSNLVESDADRSTNGPASGEPRDTNRSRDAILAGGFEVESVRQTRADEALGLLASQLGSSQSTEMDSFGEAFDSALTDLFSDSP